MARVDRSGCLFDENGQEVVIGAGMLRRFVKAPEGGIVRCADRLELWDGSIVWGYGYRGWYDEHVLQGGLRYIEYRQNPLTTLK